jgi:hypothetical protein
MSHLRIDRKTFNMNDTTTKEVDINRCNMRQSRRSSRLVEYSDVHKGDMVIDWDSGDSSLEGQPAVPESLLHVDLEDAGDVSTITDTAAESSLFTYASSSKHCNSTEMRLTAMNFLETIRESVLANNKSQEHLLQDCKESSSSSASSSSNGTVTSILTLRDGSEDTSTTTSSTSTHDETLSLGEEVNDDMTHRTPCSSTEKKSSTEYSMDEAALALAPVVPLPQPTIPQVQCSNVHPMVLIHFGDEDNDGGDIHNDEISVSSSSHCSASSHSTISTNVMTHPSYEDVEKSLMKDEAYTKKSLEEDSRLTSYFKCFNRKDSPNLLKALFIGCFFGITVSVIIIFSHLIFHTKH